ncbi:hypothetical protein FQZ97_953700 [compost metagenome]
MYLISLARWGQAFSRCSITCAGNGSFFSSRRTTKSSPKIDSLRLVNFSSPGSFTAMYSLGLSWLRIRVSPNWPTSW